MQPFQPYLPTPELQPYIKRHLVLEAGLGAGFSMNAVLRGLPVFGGSYRPEQMINWSRNDKTITTCVFYWL